MTSNNSSFLSATLLPLSSSTASSSLTTNITDEGMASTQQFSQQEYQQQQQTITTTTNDHKQHPQEHQQLPDFETTQQQQQDDENDSNEKGNRSIQSKNNPSSSEISPNASTAPCDPLDQPPPPQQHQPQQTMTTVGSSLAPTDISTATTILNYTRPPLPPPPPPPPPTPATTTTTSIGHHQQQHHTTTSTLSSDQIVGMIADVTSSSPILSGQVVKKGRFNVMVPLPPPSSSSEVSDHSNTRATTTNPIRWMEPSSSSSRSTSIPATTTTATANTANVNNTIPASNTPSSTAPSSLIDGGTNNSSSATSSAPAVTKKGRFVVTTMAPSAASSSSTVTTAPSSSVLVGGIGATAVESLSAGVTNANHADTILPPSSSVVPVPPPCVPPPPPTTAPLSSTSSMTCPLPLLFHSQPASNVPVSTAIPMTHSQPQQQQQLPPQVPSNVPLQEPYQALQQQQQQHQQQSSTAPVVQIPPFAMIGQPSFNTTNLVPQPSISQQSVVRSSLSQQPKEPNLQAHHYQPQSNMVPPSTIPPSVVVSGQPLGQQQQPQAVVVIGPTMVQPAATVSAATVSGSHSMAVPVATTSQALQPPGVNIVAMTPTTTTSESLYQTQATTATTATSNNQPSSLMSPITTATGLSGYSITAVPAAQAITGQQPLPPTPATTTTLPHQGALSNIQLQQQQHSHSYTNTTPTTAIQSSQVAAPIQYSHPSMTTAAAQSTNHNRVAVATTTTNADSRAVGSQSLSTPSSPDLHSVLPPKAVGEVGATRSRAPTSGHTLGVPPKPPPPLTGMTSSAMGFGKMFFFLEQMKLEVTEADGTIKSLQRDLKLMRDKNKELEIKNRDMERKLCEEKVLREAAESKARLIRKKYRELKETAAAAPAQKDAAAPRSRVYSEDDDLEDSIPSIAAESALTTFEKSEVQSNARAAEPFDTTSQPSTESISRQRSISADESRKLASTQHEGHEYLQVKPPYQKRSSFEYSPSSQETFKQDTVTHRRASSYDSIESPQKSPDGKRLAQNRVTSLPLGSINGKSIASGLLPPLVRSSSGSRKNDGAVLTGTHATSIKLSDYDPPKPVISLSDRNEAVNEGWKPADSLHDTFTGNQPFDAFTPRTPPSAVFGQDRVENGGSGGLMSSTTNTQGFDPLNRSMTSVQDHWQTDQTLNFASLSQPVSASADRSAFPHYDPQAVSSYGYQGGGSVEAMPSHLPVTSTPVSTNFVTGRSPQGAQSSMQYAILQSSSVPCSSVGSFPVPSLVQGQSAMPLVFQLHPQNLAAQTSQPQRPNSWIQHSASVQPQQPQSQQLTSNTPLPTQPVELYRSDPFDELVTRRAK